MTYYYKRYHDVSKITLWADSTDDEKKAARLLLSFRDGNPRFVAYTGVTGPSGIINFPCDYPTMAAAMSLLKEAASSSITGVSYSIESLTASYVDNKPTKEKVLVSTLNIGRDKDGIVFLALITEGKPKIMFQIKPSNYHVFRDSTKSPMPVDKISSTLAIGIADLVLNTISDVMTSYTREEYDGSGKPPAEIKGRNQQSGGGKKQVPSNTPTETLDDIEL